MSQGILELLTRINDPDAIYSSRLLSTVNADTTKMTSQGIVAQTHQMFADISYASRLSGVLGHWDEALDQAFGSLTKDLENFANEVEITDHFIR